MTNFASGAIPNMRMKPNLTTGLFLNGRSSAAAPGKPLWRTMPRTSHQIIVTDLVFNDTKFLEQKTNPKKKHQDHQPSTNGETDHDEDETPDNLESPPQQHTGCQKTAVTEKDTERKGEPDHTSQEDCNLLNRSNLELSPETPRTMFKKLIETGIFDGTGILKLTSDKDLQKGPIRDGENGILKNLQPVGSRAGQYGVSTTDPDKGLTLPLTTLPQSNIASFYQKHYGNNQNKSADTACLERHGEKTPLCIRDTAQVCYSDRANPVNMRDVHEASITQSPNPDLKLARDSAVDGRRESIYEALEGRHQYTPYIDHTDQRRPTLTNPDSDFADFGYLVHPTDIQSPKLVSTELPTLGDWQRYGESKLLQQSLAAKHSLHLTHGDAGIPGPNLMMFPMPSTEVYPTQDERGYTNAQVKQQRRNCGNETVREFFESIEGEVSLK
ncbi:hypothetical protein FVEN_g8946 [Fusarium venenatum]|nr:hypothetical protein FVEN_g8946 [Fusarium venenatum]